MAVATIHLGYLSNALIFKASSLEMEISSSGIDEVEAWVDPEGIYSSKRFKTQLWSTGNVYPINKFSDMIEIEGTDIHDLQQALDKNITIIAANSYKQMHKDMVMTTHLTGVIKKIAKFDKTQKGYQIAILADLVNSKTSYKFTVK